MSDMGARVLRAPRSERELFRAPRSKAPESIETAMNARFTIATASDLGPETRLPTSGLRRSEPSR